jgi:hypothetical protein
MNLFPILADPRNLVAQSGVTSKLQILCIFLATSGTAVAQSPSPEQLDLGAAKEFAVLGSTTVTNTGDTVLSGKYGVALGVHSRKPMQPVPLRNPFIPQCKALRRRRLLLPAPTIWAG